MRGNLQANKNVGLVILVINLVYEILRVRCAQAADRLREGPPAKLHPAPLQGQAGTVGGPFFLVSSVGKEGKCDIGCVVLKC
jgi:hypothetical protein